MQWMDELSGIAARRFAGAEAATAAVKEILFLKPIPQGAFVDIKARVTSVGNTSMTVETEVWLDEDKKQEVQVKAASAAFIYVVLDEEGKPCKVRRA